MIVNGLLTEKRVINALILREIHTVFGDSKLGYLWVLLQSVFGIAVFWAVRAVAGAHSPHGMPTPIFLGAGFCIFYLFSSGVSKSLSAISANRGLLTFPQVTALDVVLSRMVVICTTQILTIIFVTALSTAWGYEFQPGDMLKVIFSIICTAFFSLGTGLLVTSLAVYIPGLERVVPFVMRVLFFASCVFFSIGSFSSYISEILLLNPLVHLVEILRSGLHETYQVDGINFMFPSSCALVTMSFGLLFERHTRVRRLAA